MDKYISREAIIEELEEEIAMGDEFDEKDVLINKGLKIALKDIKRQPAADVQPMKHGRWTKDEKGVFHHCSECGGETFRDVDSWGLEYQEYCTDYCHHCGTRMDGDTNG